MRCKIYPIEGANNVRDLGGYPGGCGKPVSMRRFIRGDSMSGLSESGRRAVRDLGVDCIVDLRSTMEVRTMPGSLMAAEGIAYRHIPMLDYIQSSIVNGTLDIFPESLEEMYTGLLDNAQDAFSQAFEVFADPGYSCVLFHCTAGKDRTGLTAMLLLGLAGVADDLIVEDYAWSEHLVPPTQIKNDSRLPRYLFESKPETMRAAIRHLKCAYGGITAYLRQIGVGQKQLELIRNKLFR